LSVPRDWVSGTPAKRQKPTGLANPANPAHPNRPSLLRHPSLGELAGKGAFLMIASSAPEKVHVLRRHRGEGTADIVIAMMMQMALNIAVRWRAHGLATGSVST
jgi:hypothetical protein